MTAERGRRRTVWRDRKAGIRLLLILVIVLGAASSAFAQGSIFGTVQNSDASAPAAPDLLWWGFLDDTDEEIRIESNTGAGYDGANWFDDFQNYSTEAAGNPYDYYFNNVANGEVYHLANLIPANSFQQENIVLASAANPARPTGLDAQAVSATSVLVRWNGVSGMTYHVYRRNTSNNGVFRRVDDPTGSLSNPGVADSFFVDNTSDGVTNYTYLIIGEDVSGNYTPHSAEISVDASSAVAPAIASIFPATGATVGGTPVTIVGTGFDINGADLTIGGVSAASITVVTPFEITALTPAGSGTVDVVATNTASALASAPLVGGFAYYANATPIADAGPDQLGLDAGTLVTLDGTGSSDIDGDSLSHSWIHVAGPTVSLSSLTVAQPTFTPAVEGTYDFELTVDDGIISSVPDTIRVTINNQAPVLAAIGSQVVDEGLTLAFRWSATDADLEIPTLTAENFPANAAYVDSGNGAASFTFSPDFTQAGGYSVTFIASDGDLADTEIVSITVNDINQAPILAGIGSQVVDEGVNLNFGISASDADGGIPTLTAEDVPANATFTDNANGTGTFDFDPTFTQAGIYNVRFIASDGDLADTEVVQITVNDAGNQAPVLAAIGPQSVTENQNLNFGISATDPDTDIPALTAEDVPANATFTDNGDGTGTFNFDPDFTQASVYNVRFIASDGALADTEIVAITVNEAGNQYPVLAAIGSQSVNEGQNLNFGVSASDPDADIPTLTAEDVPANALFTDNGDGTGTFDFNPDYTQTDVYNVRFIASDGALADTEIVAITVNDAGNQAPVLAAIGAQSVTEGQNLNFGVAAADPDTDIPTLTAEDVPTNAGFTDNGDGTGVFDFNPDYLQVGVYNVRFIASDGALADTELVAITVIEAGNQAPVLAAIGPQSVTEGLNLNFGVSATDPEAAPLTLAAEDVPANATFTDNGDGTGVFDFNPDFVQASVYNVRFIVSDGALADTEIVAVTVNEAGNQYPVLAGIGPQGVDEGQNLNFIVSATDPDADIPTLTAEDVPANALFTDNGDGTGVFDFDPDYVQAGLYNVRFIASDGALADTEIVAITVNPAGNQYPVLAAIGAQSVTEGLNLNFGVSATDPDATIPILTAEDVPANATFTDNGDGTGVFDFTPDYIQAGLYNVTFIASDGSLADTEIVAITVDEAGNQFPVLAGIGPQNVTEGLNLNLALSANDVDLDSLILSAVDLPLGAVFTDNFDGTGTFDFTPNYIQAGLYNVTFIASDGALADTEIVAITVDEAGNQYPVLAGIGPQSVGEGVNLNFIASAGDPDLDSLILSAVDLPTGATFTDNFDGTGTFDFTPDYTQSGDYNVTFIASDGSLADTEIVAISVVEENLAPVLDPIGLQAVDEAQNLNFAVTASDPDGVLPALIAEDVPLNALFTDNGDGTGVFDFNPDYTQSGLYTVRFIASDGGLADTELVDITVNNINLAPVLAAIGPQAVAEGNNLNFGVSASDPDLDSLILSAIDLPANATLTDNGDGTGVFDFTPSFIQAGVYNVSFIVSDGDLADTEIVVITVSEPGNQQPVFDPILTQIINEGDTLILLVHATDPETTPVSLNYATSLPVAAFHDSGNGYATWEYRPDYYSAGTDTVRFIATDGGVPPTSAFLDVEIIVAEINQPPLMVEIGPQSVLAGDSLAIHIIATDSTNIAGNILIMTASSVPTNATFVDSGNGVAGFVFHPDFSQIGDHIVTFRSTDDGAPPMSDQEAVTISVVSQNRPPVLAYIGPKILTEGETIEFRISATDPDLTIPTLSVETVLEGYTFVDSGNGAGSFLLNAGYRQSGLYELKFIAADGIATDYEKVILQVIEAGNQVPFLNPIGPLSVQEKTDLTVSISASDLENDSLVFAVENLPLNAELVDNGDGTALFTANPDYWQQGFYDLLFTVTDGQDADSELVVLEIVDAGNQLPEFVETVGPQSVVELELLEFRVFVADPDSTIPLLSVPSLPGNATFTDSGGGVGGFSWLTTYDDDGVHIVDIRATDADDPGLVETFSVEITVEDVNRFPIFSIGPPPVAQEVDEGDTLWVLAEAYDPDGPIPVMGMESALENMIDIDSGNGRIAVMFAPGYNQAGYYQLKITAVDQVYDLDTTYRDLFIDVNQVNYPPEILPIDPPSTMEGMNLNFTVTAIDTVDGISPFVFAQNLPANASFSSSPDGTGLFDFNPDFTQAGTYTVRFIASDGAPGAQLADTLVLDITVFEAGEAPVIAPIAAQNVTEGQNLNFVVTASDVDGPIPILSAEDVPFNATWVDNGDGTGDFDFNPSYAQSGVYIVRFIASDGFLADTEFVEITVVEAGNQRPVLQPIGPQTTTEGETLIVGLSASDADQTSPTLTAEDMPDNSTLSTFLGGLGTFTFRPDYTQAGIYNVRFIASDGELADTEIVQITVQEAGNQPPAFVDYPEDTTVLAGKLYDFLVTADDPEGDLPILTAEDLPVNASFSDAGDGSGSLQFTPDISQGGAIYTVRLIASDGADADTVEATFTVLGYKLADLNADGLINPVDVVWITNYVYRYGPEPLPVAEAGDCNCDGSINPLDVVYLVNYVYKNQGSFPEVCP